MINTLKIQVGLIFLSTCLALFALLSIINFTDPNASGALTFSFFYLSLFLVSLGIFTILGLLARQWLAPKLYIVNLSGSFRQALLVSLLVVISFVLRADGLLYWWVETSLILFLLFVEIFLNLKV